MSDRKPKILIGDDSILARKQMKDMITKILPDVEFIEAKNGQEAAEKYTESHPDLTFLDIVMPVKDGVAATKDIIAADETAKIIVVSSAGTQSTVKDALVAGAKDFLQKPAKPDAIEKILKNNI